MGAPPPGWDGRSSFAPPSAADRARLEGMARSLGTALGRPVDAAGVLALFDGNRDGRISPEEATAGRGAELDRLRARLDALRWRR